MLEFLEQTKSESLSEKLEKELFESRVIHLNEDITNFSFDYIVPMIQKINKDDQDIPVNERKPIQIHITSYGGNVYDGWGIVSHMINSKTPIHTYLYSYAMSMALAMFVAGEKRYMSKYATCMYHELSSALAGTREEIRRASDEYDRLQEMYDNFLIERTKLTFDILKDHQKKVSDWYIDINDALKYQIATDLIG